MLDFADVVAINKFERRGAKDALRDVGRQLVRNRDAFGQQPDEMPVFGTSAATFNDDGVTALYQHLRDLLAGGGLPVGAGRLDPVDVRHSSGIAPGGAAGPGALPGRDHRDRAQLPRGDRASWPPSARRVQAFERRRSRARSRWRGRRRGGVRGSLDARTLDLPDVAARPARGLAGGGRVVLGRRAGRAGPRQGDPHRPDPRVVVGQQDPAGRAAPDHRPRRAGAVLAPGEPAGLLPVHRRGVPVQARRRGPGADVRRRGRPVPHQPAVQAALRRRRRHPPVDGVRLGHPLRARPRPASRHLRQGRHLRGLGRDAGRT